MKTSGGWQRADGRSVKRARFSWNRLLWALVYPQRRHRVLPTIPGIVLVALAFGIGTAAYNAANNILFITLSLLLACLVLSGILSWLNFRGIEWRLQLAPSLRAGEAAVATLSVRNTKRLLPTYGLWFDIVARAVERGAAAKAESTLTARGTDVRAALARAERSEAKGRVQLPRRLDPGDVANIEWPFTPSHRGLLDVELDSVGSLFPFGFLLKRISAQLRERVVVWPALVEHRRFAVAASRRPASGERMARTGSGSDLLALRRYTRGDSHRAIHWKASARMRQLLVRQFSAESTEGFTLWLRLDRALWINPEQLELLLSFAATLAEDLFRTGKLSSVAIDGEVPVAIRRVRDVEGFLDRLAVVDPATEADASSSVTAGSADQNGRHTAEGSGTSSRRNLITFHPDGARGVVAYVDGEKFANA